jgi:hypothetical protein
MPLPQRRVLLPGYQQGTGEPLPDNYQVILTMTDKDGQPQELSLVSETTNFSATLGEQDLTFNGTLAVDENGLIHVRYTLGWETALVNNGSTNYKSTSITGSARLKSGQEMIVFHTGTRTAKLSVKKLE